MELELVTLAERPDLMDTFWDMETSWPEFMKHDPIGNGYYASLEQFAEFVLVVPRRVGADGGQGALRAVPARRGELPDAGWDFAIRSGLLTGCGGQARRRLGGGDRYRAAAAGRRPVRADRGRAARQRRPARLLRVAGAGAAQRQDGRPRADGDYAFRTREDGLPVDPWLRVHVRAGGGIDRVAPRSMVIPGTVEEWRDWTGLPFDRTGPVDVPARWRR